MIDQIKKDWLKEIGAEEVPGEDRYSYTFDGFENEKLYFSREEIEEKSIEELKTKRYLERERVYGEAWDRGERIVSSKTEGFATAIQEFQALSTLLKLNFSRPFRLEIYYDPKKPRVVIKKCCPQKEGQHMAGTSIRATLSNSGSYDITSENIKEIVTEAVAGRSKQSGIL